MLCKPHQHSLIFPCFFGTFDRTSLWKWFCYLTNMLVQADNALADHRQIIYSMKRRGSATGATFFNRILRKIITKAASPRAPTNKMTWILEPYMPSFLEISASIVLLVLNLGRQRPTDAQKLSLQRQRAVLVHMVGPLLKSQFQM